ncbi:unnamed protein product [Thlaspi arvense]|uniref:BHLH domain-containing protein n=1 Tax=Thlaspi arvense TaxID=13288 RepID=A0AAU9SMH0_THLAR|nr:unnamed protein product [Thlaspi arvense]
MQMPKFLDWYLKIAIGSAIIGGGMEYFMIKTDDKVTVLEAEKRAYEDSPEAQATREALNPWRNKDAETSKKSIVSINAAADDTSHVPAHEFESAGVRQLVLFHIFAFLYIYMALDLSTECKEMRKMVKCKKVKHRDCKGRKEKPKLRETCMRRNLGILRRIVPGCEEVDDEEALFLKSIQHLMLLKSQVTFLRKLADVCGV